MKLDNRLLHSLHRLYLNGKLREFSRGDDDLYGAPLSSYWLKSKESDLGEVLHGITRTAAIIYGPQHVQILFDAAYNESVSYRSKPSIVVSTEPIKRPLPGFSFYDAVDTITGQVIHEAAHLRERQADEALFADDEILSVLYHLVEDAIIDTMITIEYPGFEDYLLKYRRYLIDEKLRKSWGFKIEGRLKQLILSVRSTWPVRINRWSVRRAYLYMLYLLSKYRTIEQLRRLNRTEIAEQLYSILYDERHADHWRDPDVLSESFVLGMEGPPVKGEKGNNRGSLESKPLTRQSLDQLNLRNIEWVGDVMKTIQSSEINREKFNLSKALTKQWTEMYRHKKNPASKQQAISSEEMRIIHKKEKEKWMPLKGVDGKYDYQVHLSQRPLYYKAAERYHSAVNAVRVQIIGLRNVLAWANTGTYQHQLALTSGDLDEDALYRAKYATDLFTKTTVVPYRSQKLDIVLLVDTSRSMKQPMAGSDVPRYIVAQRLTALFVESLATVESVQTWAFSFSSLEKAVDIYELYSPDAKADKARIGDIYPNNQTPEYEALLAVSQHMQDIARIGVRKVYIIFSDGCPEDDVIPQDVQYKEIKKLVKRLLTVGDSVIHIALGPDAAPQKSAYPYRIEFPEEGFPELVRRFGKLLKKLVSD